MVCAASAALVLVLVPDLASQFEPGASGEVPTVRSVLREHRRMLMTLGTAAFTFSALRAVRQVVVPLWAVHIGLGAEQTSIVFGISSAFEMLLFYPAGKLMDRFGRLIIAIPSPVILGVSMLLLPLTHSEVTLTLVATLMSVGNGIGSGIQMTIGADLAPAVGRLRFLSVWRVWSDTGQASGPLALSALTAVSSLGAGIVGLGLLGLYAGAAMGAWLPRYSPFALWRRRRA